MLETSVTDGAAVVNANTSTGEVMKTAAARTDAEAFGTEESLTSESNASAKAGEADKAQADTEKPAEEANAEVGEDEGTNEVEGEPIPYQRFNKVIKERNSIKGELATLKAQADEMSTILNDPDVLRLALSKQGWKEDKINALLKERGIESKTEAEGKTDDVSIQLKDLAKDLDLSTTDGWAMYQYRIAQLAAENKSKEKIAEYDEGKMSEKKAKDFVSEQEKMAKVLAEKTYNIPYGEPGKDDVKRNIETALGRIAVYLDKNPEDAYLGHAKLLKLAFSEEGYKKGEDKGVIKERERQAKLKTATLEGDESARGTETPNSNWSIQQINEWRKLHPNAII